MRSASYALACLRQHQRQQTGKAPLEFLAPDRRQALRSFDARLNQTRFYSNGPEGYIDYPTLAGSVV